MIIIVELNHGIKINPQDILFLQGINNFSSEQTWMYLSTDGTKK